MYLTSILMKELIMLSVRREKDRWNMFQSLSILELFDRPKSRVSRMGLLVFWLLAVAQLWTETWHAVLLQIPRTLLLRNGEFFQLTDLSLCKKNGLFCVKRSLVLSLPYLGRPDEFGSSKESWELILGRKYLTNLQDVSEQIHQTFSMGKENQKHRCQLISSYFKATLQFYVCTRLQQNTERSNARQHFDI